MTDMNHNHDKRKKFIDTMRRKAKAEESRRMKQRESKLDEWDAKLLLFNEELHVMWTLTHKLTTDYGMTRDQLVEHANLVRLSRQALALLFAQSDPSTRLDYLSFGERHGSEPLSAGDAPGFGQPE